MTIQRAQGPRPPGAPNARLPVIDDNGSFNSTGIGQQTDMLNYFIGTSRLIPCEETGTNVLALTMLSISPLIKQYNDYDTYQVCCGGDFNWISDGKRNKPIQGSNSAGTFATLKVFKTNGAAQATTGDVVLGHSTH